MAGEIFKVVGRIALEGVQAVEKGMKSTQSVVKKAESSLKEVAGASDKAGASFAETGSDADSKLKQPLDKVGTVASNMASKFKQAMSEVKTAIEGADKKIEDFGNSVKEQGEKVSSAGETMSKVFTVPLAAMGLIGSQAAGQFENSMSRTRAQLGLTEAEAEKFAGVGNKILKNGWGDNLDDVTQAIVAVKNQLKDIPDDQLQAVTEKAIMLQDVFDMDMNESLRGINSLMSSYGMTAEQAFDYMVVGAQNGLDKTGELGDNLAEYAPLWEQNGYSAEQMFNVLQAGLDGGAYNLDKVNDLVKEFGVRMSDGAVMTALEEMGGGWAELGMEIENGSYTNQEAFQMIATKVSELGNEQLKASAVSAIFGSMGEDAGNKVIEAMANAADQTSETAGAFDDVTGAAEKASQAAGDNFSSKLQTMWQTAKQALLPVGTILMDFASTWLPEITNGIQTLSDWFAGLSGPAQTLIVIVGAIVAAIGPVLLGIGSLMTLLGPVIAAIGGIGLVTFGWIGALVAVGAALIAAWNSSATFRDGVMQVFQAIVGYVKPLLTDFIGFIKGIFSQILTFWNENGAMIQQAFSNVFNFLMSVVQFILPTVMAFVTGFINGIKNIIQGGIDVILGVIKLFSAVFTGNWSAAFAAVKQVISGAIQFIIGLFQTGLVGKAMGIARAFGSKVGGLFSAFGSKVSGIFSGLIGRVMGLWSSGFGRVSSITSKVINTVKSFVTSGLNAVASKFSGIVSSISGIWGRVTGVIKKPVQTAVNFVKSAVGKITGFFKGMKISFPKIKLPHFKVTGKLSIAPPSVPKLSVDWYKEGGLFNGPSIIGVGEQPGVSEAVLPLRDDVFAKIGQGIQKATGHSSLGAGVTQILVKVFVDGEEISSVIEPIITEIQGYKSDQELNTKGAY